MLATMVNNLKATGIPLVEFGWRNAPKPPYMVWGADGTADTIHADGKLSERAKTGTIDLYSAESMGTDYCNVEKALNMSGVAWSLNSVQYEDGAGLVHYEWVWEALDG